MERYKMRYKKRVEDARCLNCRDFGEYLGIQDHGVYSDHNYECRCGAKWSFITENELLHRYQLEYPKE